MQKNKPSSIHDEEQKIKSVISKISNIVSDENQFVADYIEIDKNALLYICDLLAIEPVQGHILQSIIEFVESNESIQIQNYYKEILQLFGVNTTINDKTQEMLIGEIKNFRITISTLLQKVTILEDRNENILKENYRMNKQLSKLEIKQQRVTMLENLLNDEN